MLFALCLSAEAQQPKKIPRIGYLTWLTFLFHKGRPHRAFRQGLRDLGYLEGKSIVLEYRNAEGKIATVPVLATELVRLKVDMIVTAGPL